MVAALQADRETAAAQVGRLGRWATRLRQSGLMIGLETIGLIGLLFAAVIFTFELKERQDERTARAWQSLTTPAPGNGGKIKALEYLNSRSLCLPEGWKLPLYGKCWKEPTPLAGIQLSKEIHQGNIYLRRINLTRANLKDANLTGVVLEGANLTRADLAKANLTVADLTKTNLTGTSFIYANLTGANLSEANLSGTFLGDADLTGADLGKAYLSGSFLWSTNLTETNFKDAEYIDEAKIWGIWAWEGRPPKNAPQNIMENLVVRKLDETDDDAFFNRLIKTVKEQQLIQ